MCDQVNNITPINLSMLFVDSIEMLITYGSFRECSWKYYIFNWPNDQTLLVKHLNFSCQAKCLTIWPRPKTLLAQYFLFASSKTVLELFQKHHTRNFVSFACQAMFLDVPNGQTFVVESKFKMLDQ